MKMVDIKIWYFKTFSTVSTVKVKKRAQIIEKIEETIPILVIINGKYNESCVVTS